MNHDTHTTRGDEALRLQLRGLRRDLPPPADLWPGIAQRLQPRVAVATPRRGPRWPPFALAASLVLVAGLAWKMPGGLPPGGPEPLVAREAQALSRQYQGAFQELDRLPRAGDAGVYAPALQELDRSASQILGAIERDPQSRLLLDQLRRTYARRLALAQRATLTT